MSAHVAAPPVGRVLDVLADDVAVVLQLLTAGWLRIRPVLATVWRVSWPTLVALPVGADIVLGGLVLQQAGHQDAAMLLMYGSLLVLAMSLAWLLSDGES